MIPPKKAISINPQPRFWSGNSVKCPWPALSRSRDFHISALPLGAPGHSSFLQIGEGFQPIAWSDFQQLHDPGNGCLPTKGPLLQRFRTSNVKQLPFRQPNPSGSTEAHNSPSGWCSFGLCFRLGFGLGLGLQKKKTRQGPRARAGSGQAGTGTWCLPLPFWV